MNKLPFQFDVNNDKDISSILQFRPLSKQDKEAGSRIELSQVNGRIQVDTKTKAGKTTDQIAYKSDLVGITSDATIQALTARVQQLEALVAKLTRFATIIDESIYFEGWDEQF